MLHKIKKAVSLFLALTLLLACSMTTMAGESGAKLKLLTGYDYDEIFINTDGILVAEKNGDDYRRNGDYGTLSEDGVWTQDDSVSTEDPRNSHSPGKYTYKDIEDQRLIETLPCVGWHNEVTPCKRFPLHTLRVANIYDLENQTIVDDTNYIGPGGGFGGPEDTTIDDLEYYYYLELYPTSDRVNFYLKNKEGKWGIKNVDTGVWVVEQKFDTLDQIKAAYQFYLNPNQTVYSTEYTIVNNRPVFNVYKYTSSTERYKVSVDFSLVSDFDRYESLGSYVVATTWPVGITSQVDEGAIRTQKILDLNGDVVASLKGDEYISPYYDRLTNSLFVIHDGKGKAALATIEGSTSSTESIVDTNTGVGVEAPAGTIPDGSLLEVNKIQSGDSFILAKGALGSAVNQFTLFDISFIKDNAKVQPDGKVKITIPIPEGYNKEKLAVYYISDDGISTELESVIEDSNISFETDHFSYYAVAEKAEQTAVPVKTTVTDIPRTGDMMPAVLLLTAVLSAGTIALCCRCKNLKRNSD